MLIHKASRIAIAATIFAAAGLAVGCSADHRASEYGAMPVEAYAGTSLGAGDALGMQVFANDGEGATRFAILRKVDDAIALAEAKEAAGEYDEWYASFIRPGDEREDGTAIAGVEVPDDQ